MRKTISYVVLLLAGIATSTLVVAAEPSPGWPCWRGPFGNGAGVDCGETLVDNLSNAVEVWSCPLVETGPHGYADLAVAEGRVYSYLFRPGGDQVHEPSLASPRIKGTPEERRRQALLFADDVIQCMDAATGRVLWRRVYRAKGANQRLIGIWSVLFSGLTPTSAHTPWSIRTRSSGRTPTCSLSQSAVGRRPETAGRRETIAWSHDIG
jgi:outer membrane protein assembly factor BamB